MRFHVASLPHTQTTADFCWCAYTSKVRRFCNMMHSLGHDVFLYGGTQNEAKVTEFITVVTDEDREKWFGHYNWDTMVFGDWDSKLPCWKETNKKISQEIKARKQPGDFLCIIAGWCQADLVNELPDMRAVEWGIGYEGILPNTFHVFESTPWMHYVYGMNGIKDGRFFDTVIPNSFEENEFIYHTGKSDYILYLGRMTPRKGLAIVEELANLGHKIITAGQGDLRVKGASHVGVVRGATKSELLANAKALIAPTTYIEPFGGVAIEAMLSGTPVITTDFGAFTETVIDGVNGFRCNTLGDFHRAAAEAKDLNPWHVRSSALKYDTQTVKYQYEDYFKRLSLLDGKGWYHI